MFLGIFRLKNNGNFFGAKDGNEAFFYPLRVVVALILVAPVVPVSSAGGVPITLTTGHALIAGVSKMAAEFGDTMQHDAFELMHRHNLFSDPQFRVEVDYWGCPGHAQQLEAGSRPTCGLCCFPGSE